MRKFTGDSVKNLVLKKGMLPGKPAHPDPRWTSWSVRVIPKTNKISKKYILKEKERNGNQMKIPRVFSSNS